MVNKTCHRDRIARLTAPCPSHKKLKRKNFNILLMPMPTPTPMPTPGVVQQLFLDFVQGLNRINTIWNCNLPIYPTVPTRPLIDSPSGISTANPRSDILT